MTARSAKRPDKPAFHLRLKIAPGVDFGPGKAQLLEQLAETGSITAAAKAMRMSYRRAWLLLDEMNRQFKAPLARMAKGGAGGGGADLTADGRAVLRLYRAAEAGAGKAVATPVARLRRRVKP
ncbi:MAG: LysR family transcriptional regulator [Rhodospirillaceae bacterium]|nr:LysR family transcriptional regulator [Rhodospirillaceae bacterium]